MSRFALFAVLLLAAPVFAAPPVCLEDAPLRAVWFADAREGWAAGDHGVVWHTIDGGQTWEIQRTGTRASLRAVHFLSPYTGFAVGRVELPHDAGSHGVVLRTEDGGANWKELTSSTLPGLNAVRFADENRGVVFGDGTDGFPTGAFSTTDGGKSWSAITGPRAGSWTSAAMTNATSGIVGGMWGKLMLVRDGKLTAPELDPLGNRAVRGIVTDGTRAVAVADGGRILTSANSGAKWGFANLPVAQAAADAFDFRCVASAGNHVWAAGRPGSVVFHSSDFGKTWETQKTGHPVPLNSICMADAQTGWAVGELGTILGTANGGKTWSVLKCGGQKSAVMFAHATAKSSPLGVVGTVGGTDGYLAVSLAFTGSDPATADPKRAADEFRMQAAVRGIGGATAESDTGLSPENFLRSAVLALRTWRPDVVVTDAFPAAGVEKEVLAAMHEAFKQAADPTKFPEQIEALGLQVHAPKKLYAMSTDAPDATVKYDLTLFAAALTDSPRDAAEPFASLVPGCVSAERQCFRLLSHRLKGSENHAFLTDGLDLPEGGTARRKKADPSPAVALLLGDREKAGKLRRQLELMVQMPGDPEKALVHAARSVSEMPDDMAARTAVALGKRFAEEGKWTAAREMYSLVAEKYPAHAESAEAFRWLARFYSSSEVRRRIELGQLVIFQKAAFEPAGSTDVKQATHLEPSLAKQVYRFSSPEAARQWNQACLDLEPKLAAFGAAYARDPATNLCLLAARRQLGLYGDAAKSAQILARNASTGSDPWRECASAEVWLGNPQQSGVRPKPLALAVNAAAKPFLDGKLDDACWKNFNAQPLTDSAGTTAKAYPTDARFAFDDKFLYVAVRCGHPDGKQVIKADKRRYDDDLRGHDRVDILLDLDRDYQTFYRLQVDHRGCVAEDCWGDKTWNPKWFVAVEPTPTGWTAEIAIPLTELTGTAPTPGVTWAANVVRVLPGEGVQSWSGPASDTPRPEGFGLLQFAK
jgi:photosystem II stability/assembly factor-like uncharacterized protein